MKLPRNLQHIWHPGDRPVKYFFNNTIIKS